MEAIAVKRHLSKRGNAVGFGADGRAIIGQWLKYARAWQISHATEQGIIADARRFTSKGEAAEYAASVIDDATTERLAWWDYR
jgi:hypothetical protein